MGTTNINRLSLLLIIFLLGYLILTLHEREVIIQNPKNYYVPVYQTGELIRVDELIHLVQEYEYKLEAYHQKPCE